MTTVGKVKHGHGFFAAGGQTNGFSQFKVYLFANVSAL